MGSLIFDTTFLIDYQRERKKVEGDAHRFLLAHQGSSMLIPAIVLGEFGEGFASLSDRAFLETIVGFEVLPITEAVASIYSEISRNLRSGGRLIQTNDLWISAVAIDSGFPLVTKNSEHFARIPGLELRSY